MPNTIRLKRKTTTGAPSLSDFAVGEMCFNIPDEILHLKKDEFTIIEVASTSHSLQVARMNVKNFNLHMESALKNWRFTLSSLENK
jgi:hypothetical protein